MGKPIKMGQWSQSISERAGKSRRRIEELEVRKEPSCKVREIEITLDGDQRGRRKSSDRAGGVQRVGTGGEEIKEEKVCHQKMLSCQSERSELLPEYGKLGSSAILGRRADLYRPRPHKGPR